MSFETQTINEIMQIIFGKIYNTQICVLHICIFIYLNIAESFGCLAFPLPVVRVSERFGGLLGCQVGIWRVQGGVGEKRSL